LPAASAPPDSSVLSDPFPEPKPSFAKHQGQSNQAQTSCLIFTLLCAMNQAVVCEDASTTYWLFACSCLARSSFRPHTWRRWVGMPPAVVPTAAGIESPNPPSTTLSIAPFVILRTHHLLSVFLSSCRLLGLSSFRKAFRHTPNHRSAEPSTLCRSPAVLQPESLR